MLTSRIGFFFYSAKFSEDSSKFLSVSIVLSFLLVNNIPWGERFSLFNHSPIKEHLDCFQFGLLSIGCYETLWTGFCVILNFCFSGINAPECNCWIIMELACLVSLETAIFFSIPTSNVCMTQFLLFASIWCYN